MWFSDSAFKKLSKEQFIKKMGAAHPHLIGSLSDIYDNFKGEKKDEKVDSKRVGKAKKRKV